jgi:hypothetical protein
MIELSHQQINTLAAGPAIDHLIEVEVNKTTPLTPEELAIFKVTQDVWARGQFTSDPIKTPLSVIDPKTGASYTLTFPQEYSNSNAYGKPWLVLWDWIISQGYGGYLGCRNGTWEAILDQDRKPDNSINVRGNNRAIVICRAALRVALYIQQEEGKHHGK